MAEQISALSYEQLEFESAESADLALGKLSFSSHSHFYQEHTEAPLSTLGDLRKYVQRGLARPRERIEYIHLEGQRQSETVSAYGNGAGGSISLEGKTDASFDPSFKTAGVTVKEAEGCSCSEGKCIRARGALQANYRVDIKVTLPKVSDYPDLDASQKKRFQKAVTSVLAPHEQKHMAAYKKYRGTTSRRFDLTTCEGNFDAEVQAMFDAEEAPRRQAVKDESDALDPFYFEFEL